MHHTLFIGFSMGTKLIAVVNWIFYVSIFLRSFMISFKYGLILLRILQLVVFYVYQPYYHIQYIIVTSEITYSYWFVIIFFFFILKMFLVSLSFIVSFSFFILKYFSYFFNCGAIYFFHLFFKT